MTYPIPTPNNQRTTDPGSEYDADDTRVLYAATDLIPDVLADFLNAEAAEDAPFTDERGNPVRIFAEVFALGRFRPAEIIRRWGACDVAMVAARSISGEALTAYRYKAGPGSKSRARPEAAFFASMIRPLGEIVYLEGIPVYHNESDMLPVMERAGSRQERVLALKNEEINDD
jgi:hypothetical protein